MHNKKFVILFIISITIISSLAFIYTDDDRDFQLLQYLEIYSNILKELRENYIDTIEPKKIITAGINATLNQLDPYTIFYDEDQIEIAKFEQQGKFSGIGILILKIKGKFYITDVLQNSPAWNAGIRPGDIIIAINDKKTNNLTYYQLHNLMSGAKNTSVKITILRANKKINITTKLTILKDNPISYYTTVENFGYIKINTFYPSTSLNMKKAVSKLKKQNIKGIIIDLRDNPGGILSEAVNTANIFLPKNMLIVYSKGKKTKYNKKFYTQYKPILPNIPMTVLVNEYSASAAEIFAGSMQDYDRGVIIGRQTVGKGLVQQFFNTGYNTQMKITIAKYYIPSGRCIQAIDYSKHKNFKNIPDSLLTPFKTKNGRIVYESKGIIPDIMIKKEKISDFINKLKQNNLLFLFSIEFYYKHNSPKDTSIHLFSEKYINELAEFLKKENFKYQTKAEKFLDSAKNALNPKFAPKINTLKKQIHKSLEQYISENYEQISKIINLWLYKIHGDYTNYYKNLLQNDPFIDSATKVLSNKNKYEKILNINPKK